MNARRTVENMLYPAREISARHFLPALALCLAAAGTVGAAPTALVPRGSVWKYLDNGSDQGTAWRAPGFSDAEWKSGPAELGYGDGDEATTVSFGGNPSSRFITTYFRHTFPVTEPAAINSVNIGIKRDDGAVVYLNGTEVFRTNMPTGTVTAATTASSTVDDATFHAMSVSPSLLVEGSNVLAVEVHQSGATSSDVSFDLELTAFSGVNVTRGPYLQQGTPESVVVRWRTDATTDSRVMFGSAPDRLTSSAESAAATGEHIVALTGLRPDTKYYYSVGTRSSVLAGGDARTFFVTSPVAGTRKPTRLWVLGDSGTANANARAVRDGYLAYTGTRHTDLWLMLGDNAYSSGTDPQYQTGVFDMYPDMLRKSVLWPTLGNHDAVNAFSSSETGPYYNIFTLPKQGEAGGLPSGTEAYYSFDYANIHFVCLDSQDSNRNSGSPMMTWLQNDLAAASQDWTIVFFHHPPYTKGSHDSDNPRDSGGRLRDMREIALPIIEASGVDLVLTGHSHSYERSFLLNGHYDVSSTFHPSMKLDGGDGRIGGNGAYKKSAHSAHFNDGAVYAVAGSSGQISGGSLDHPAMFVSLNSLGSIVIDVDHNQLDARFLGTAGNVLDSFSMVKDMGTSPAVARISRLDASPTTATVLRYQVEFTQSVAGVDAGDFAAQTTGGPNAAVSAVSGSGSRYEVAVTVTSGSAGTVQLNLQDDDSIRNGIGVALGGTGAGNGGATGETYILGPDVPVRLGGLTTD